MDTHRGALGAGVPDVKQTNVIQAVVLAAIASVILYAILFGLIVKADDFLRWVL